MDNLECHNNEDVMDSSTFLDVTATTVSGDNENNEHVFDTTPTKSTTEEKPTAEETEEPPTEEEPTAETSMELKTSESHEMVQSHVVPVTDDNQNGEHVVKTMAPQSSKSPVAAINIPSGGSAEVSPKAIVYENGVLKNKNVRVYERLMSVFENGISVMEQRVNRLIEREGRNSRLMTPRVMFDDDGEVMPVVSVSATAQEMIEIEERARELAAENEELRRKLKEREEEDNIPVVSVNSMPIDVAEVEHRAVELATENEALKLELGRLSEDEKEEEGDIMTVQSPRHVVHSHQTTRRCA